MAGEVGGAEGDLKDENGFLDEEVRRTDILYDTRLKKNRTHSVLYRMEPMHSRRNCD